MTSPEKEPLVTVIVPVYNVEKYLYECVDSILSQSYRNLEIILVDDGSTDSSRTICDEYNNKDSRIKVIHKKNGGLSDARNAGLEAASGEYIAFTDSDDYLSPFFIEIMEKVLREGNCDVVTLNGGTDFWDDEDSRPQLAESRLDYSAQYLPVRNVLERILYQQVATGAPFKFCRREVFNDLRFPVGYYYEDVATTYKEFLYSFHRDENSKSAIVTGRLYAYRKRADSIIRQGFNEKKLSALKIFDQLVRDKDLTSIGLHKAAASRVYAMLYSVFLQVPEENKDLQKKIWEKLQTAQKIVMFDKSKLMRKKNRFAAWISLLGMNASYKIGRKFGQKGSRK